MEGFAFNYLGTDGVRKRIGPFTQKEAEKRQNQFAKSGMICSKIFPTKKDPPAKRNNFAELKIAEFEDFFQKEMALFKTESIEYAIIYQFLLTLIYHIKLFVAEHDWSKSPYADILVKKTGRPPNYYLREVAKIISTEASLYSPADGSVWEDLAKELRALARQVRSGAALDKKKAQSDLISNFKGYSL